MQDKMEVESQIQLAIRLSTPKFCVTAENIFRRLHEEQHNQVSLGVLANKLSASFEALGNKAKKNEFSQLADAYINGARQ
jgi:hypothetical protein